MAHHRGLGLPEVDTAQPINSRFARHTLKAAEAKAERWQLLAIIRLIALTGCRAGEIINLDRSECHGAESGAAGEQLDGFADDPCRPRSWDSRPTARLSAWFQYNHDVDS